MPNLELSERLARRFDRLSHVAVETNLIGYRTASPLYADGNDVLSGEGSRMTGGRWNPVGLTAVYLSLSPEAALAETLAYFCHYGLPIARAMPRVFVAVDVKLTRVIDLTDSKVRRQLRLSRKRLLSAEWRAQQAAGELPLTQLAGRVAADCGYEGLRVNSAALHGGENLVIFRDNLGAASILRIHGDG